MATAGVVIASAVAVEDATSRPVETAVDVFMQPIVEVGHRQHAVTAVAGRTVPRTPQPRGGERRMLAAADRTAAAVDRTAAVNTISQ
jgi:hypothetical protein